MAPSVLFTDFLRRLQEKAEPKYKRKRKRPDKRKRKRIDKRRKRKRIDKRKRNRTRGKMMQYDR